MCIYQNFYGSSASKKVSTTKGVSSVVELVSSLQKGLLHALYTGSNIGAKSSTIPEFHAGGYKSQTKG
jgi:hypothetical protein